MPRKPSQGANLATIAKRLNVSISTISRAIRNADGIHPDTRMKVLKIADEVGYRIPTKKSGELKARPHQILALTQCSSSSTDQGYLTGLSRASVSMNLAILSHHVATNDCTSVLEPKNQPTSMRAGVVEGLVLIHRWPPEVARELAERFPVVSIIHQYPDSPVDLVGIDDRSGFHQLVSHLRDGGARRIGFFGFCRQMSWARYRFAAFFEALIHLGLPFDQQDVVEITLDESLAVGGFKPGKWGDVVLARTRDGVDAWVCPSSGTSEALLRFLLQNNLRVPDDVAITGYHQQPWIAADLPSLTTTIVADEELGASALRRLVHRFQNPSESSRSILIPPIFFQGSTTRRTLTPEPVY